MYESQWEDQPRQLLPTNLGDDVLLVTMSIAGNDVGFADIIRDCADGWELLPFDNCVSDPEKTEEPFQQALDRLKGQGAEGDTSKTRPLWEVYRDPRLRAPRARVVIVGYPQFFKTSGTMLFRCSGVKKADQKWANEKAAELNETISRFAEAHGFEFVDTTPPVPAHAGRDRHLPGRGPGGPEPDRVRHWPGSDVVLTATSPSARTITPGTRGGTSSTLLGLRRSSMSAIEDPPYRPHRPPPSSA